MTQAKPVASKPRKTTPTNEPVRAKTNRYLLRLYVAGATPQSTRAILNMQKICEEHLSENYHLEVIDIYQRPQLAKDKQIIAVPTLVKYLPAPLRKLIGNFSDTERVLVGLDLRELPAKARQK